MRRDAILIHVATQATARVSTPEAATAVLCKSRFANMNSDASVTREVREL